MRVTSMYGDKVHLGGITSASWWVSSGASFRRCGMSKMGRPRTRCPLPLARPSVEPIRATRGVTAPGRARRRSAVKCISGSSRPSASVPEMTQLGQAVAQALRHRVFRRHLRRPPLGGAALRRGSVGDHPASPHPPPSLLRDGSSGAVLEISPRSATGSAGKAAQLQTRLMLVSYSAACAFAAARASFPSSLRCVNRSSVGPSHRPHAAANTSARSLRRPKSSGTATQRSSKGG